MRQKKHLCVFPHTSLIVKNLDLLQPLNFIWFQSQFFRVTIYIVENGRLFNAGKVLEVIEREYVEQAPFWQNAIINEFNNFILFLLRNTQLITLPFDSSAKPNSLSQIHLYLRSRYQENITLDKLARLFFLNKYYIAHAFQKKYSVSIVKFLNMVRCNEAKKLLETTDLSITEIAISVGFNSSSHFTETYKKIIDETPAQTRKRFYKHE